MATETERALAELAKTLEENPEYLSKLHFGKVCIFLVAIHPQPPLSLTPLIANRNKREANS